MSGDADFYEVPLVAKIRRDRETGRVSMEIVNPKTGRVFQEVKSAMPIREAYRYYFGVDLP